jgi:hypothetical protein
LAFLLACASLSACGSSARSTSPAAKPIEAPRFDLVRAARYLDARALDWVHHTPEAGQNFPCALSCHTTHAFVAVRARLPAPSPALDEVRKRIEARVLDNPDWSKATPLYGKPGSKLEASSRATEAVMNAATLALADSTADREVSPVTIQAFDHLWRMQSADGGFEWLSFALEPWESSRDFGAAVAALAVGSLGPDQLRARRAEIDRLSAHLRERLKDEARPMALHDQALLLWATRRLPDLLDPVARGQINDRLHILQQADGGWSLATWGRGKRALGNTAPSDAYATALATIALAEGDSLTARSVRRGLDWLAAHQGSDGAWPAQSLNADKEPNNRFMIDAASAYAAYALARYGS